MHVAQRPNFVIMNGHRTSDLMGEYDGFGMPTAPAAPARGSGLMNRLRKTPSRTPIENDDDDIGADAQEFPGFSLRDMNSLGDRHRYPTMDSSSRTMSMASNATHDTTPIIPMLGQQSMKKGANHNYRQRMIDQRKQLMASDTALPMPGAPGTKPRQQRTLSNLGQDPFQGFSNRTMSMSSQSVRSPQPPSGFRGHNGNGMHNGLSNGYGPSPPAHAPNGSGRPSSRGPDSPSRELEAAQNEVMRLRAQLQERPSPRTSGDVQLQAAYSELSDKHALLSDRTEALAAQLEQLGLQHETLTANHEALASQYAALSSEHSALTSDHTELGDQHTRLASQHEALRQDHAALNDQHGALVLQNRQLSDDGDLQEDYRALASTHAEMERRYNDLQDQHDDLRTQHDELLNEHDHLNSQFEKQAQDSQETTESLQMKLAHATETEQQYTALQEAHEALKAENETLRNQAPAGPAESESLEELRKVNQLLTQELHTLSIELAESARRELNLPTSSKPDNLAGVLSRLESELAYERTRRLQAEKHLHVPIDSPDLVRSHAEATHLLDMRSQEYDMLQTRLNDALESQRSVSERGVKSPSDSDLDIQYRKLHQHTTFVEQENSRLQKMLDEVSDKGPLADRLKSVEDQRDVLQEALRSLRERKDHEIRLLTDRSRQLEARLERPRLTSAGSGARVYSASRSSVSSEDLSFNSGDASADLDKLEPPRMRTAPRPASPLHINFNMDMFPPEQRMRTEQRTSPLPLALGN